LHAHHVHHWEDGGLTDLVNLVLVCPFHHRLHHRGGITISGPAHHLVVTDAAGRPLPGADRETRRLVVVRPLRPPTSDDPLKRPSRPIARAQSLVMCSHLAA
jgi:hypothetical protein